MLVRNGICLGHRCVRLIAGLILLLTVAACGGGGSSGDSGASGVSVDGTVSGLIGTMVLQNNGSDSLSISANGTFNFSTALQNGSLYNVTVSTQPAGQTCTVANGAGTVSGANVTNVSVTCATNPFTVGGTVSGLSGSLVLQNNGANNLPIAVNGPFNFSTALPNSNSYSVTVLTQPAGQTCTVTNGAGTVSGANISNVSVNCAVDTFTVGGTVSGLSGNLVLLNNGGNNLTIAVNGNFNFSTALPNSSSYSVTVLTQPAGQTCTITNGAGTVSGANVTNVTVTCATNTFSLGGAVSGLAGTLVLQVNGGNNLTVSANGPFTFGVPLADGTPYSVTVFTQPAGQSCSIAGGTGTIAGANVTTVSVSCAANTFTVGGTVSGLSGSLVLQNNGGNNLTIAVNGTFNFSTALPNSSSYSVTVLTQPTGQTCTVANGAGTVSRANVTSVSVACSNNSATYTTSFDLTENPISEVGKWINGKTVGLDWNNVKTDSGRAIGSVLLGVSRYADDIALLSGPAFAANQYAQATVYLAPGYSPPGNHEVELLLRFTISANDAHGYEVLWGRAGYIAIVRWNGPVGNYTPLYDPGLGSIPQPVDGDVLRAEISGNRITVYRNGSSVANVVASVDITVAGGTVYSAGQPGIGFWPVDGATPENYGWKDFTTGNLP